VAAPIAAPFRPPITAPSKVPSTAPATHGLGRAFAARAARLRYSRYWPAHTIFPEIPMRTVPAPACLWPVRWPADFAFVQISRKRQSLPNHDLHCPPRSEPPGLREKNLAGAVHRGVHAINHLNSHTGSCGNSGPDPGGPRPTSADSMRRNSCNTRRLPASTTAAAKACGNSQQEPVCEFK